MTLEKLIKIISGKGLITNEKIKNIKTDSRKIEKGDIFIALKGDNYDGHDYAQEAIKKGAIACITEKHINDKCIVVKDTYQSLFDIGLYLRNKYNIPLIAITGSSGKTTTKDLIYHILSSKYKVLKNEGSKNNIIGITETLFNLNDKYDLIVMELGSNHIGEISYLSKLCNPDISIITNIGTSHIGYFKSKKNIYKEKLSIRDGMESNNIIINGDDKYLKKLNYFKCGMNKNNDLKAYNIKEELNKVTFNIKLDKEYKIIFNNPGIHFINDIMLAIKVCLDLNINIKTIIKRIKSFKMIDKRMNVLNINNNILINDCYNSSLESIKAGINYMSKINNKKIFIIGDILELGKHSKIIHKKINKLLKKIKNKEVYTVGKYSKYIKGVNYKNVDELIENINIKNIDNCYIYIKGSRRMYLDKFVDFIKQKSII